ncbi:COG3014 family protein [Shewanella sp.]|uniref:COG3014 family protein n=1 Tax=Shewanella sp. TaxID=50422 RepID=UPI003565FE3E
MKRLYPALLTLTLPLILGGCAMGSLFISYPSQIAPVKQALSGPTPLAPLPELAGEINSRDGLLYAQEAGRVAQIGGDFNASQTYYQAAIAAYARFDDKALVSVSELGASAGSLVLNDNLIPYRGPGFERIMVHQYQALNYLMQNDFEGALVEVRRANDLQELEQKRYEKSKDAVKAMANGTVDAEISRLGQQAGGVTSSFLNAYSYYTTGLLHELLGEENDAFIDYRKAAQIFPGNSYLEQDLVRLAKQLSMPQYDEFKARFGEARLPKQDEGQLVVLVERGFVPEKQALTVPFTIDGNWQTISLPTYGPAYSQVLPASLTGLDKPLNAAAIANLDALAINALKEELPGLLFRQAARVYAKSELTRSVQSDSKKRRDDFDGAAVAMQIFNVITEQADRRSWLTLPRQAQIARTYTSAGQYRLSFGNTATDIEITPGQTTLVWAIDTGNNIRFYSINIKRKWN